MLLILPVPAADVFVFTTSRDSAVTDGGIRLSVGTQPLVLDVDTHGDIVKREWLVRTTGGADVVASALEAFETALVERTDANRQRFDNPRIVQ